MTNAERIIKMIEDRYSEDEIAGMIDEQMYDYVDPDQCEEEFDGDTFECYTETGNNAAESDILNQLVELTGLIPVDEDWEELTDWWSNSMGFSL